MGTGCYPSLRACGTGYDWDLPGMPVRGGSHSPASTAVLTVGTAGKEGVGNLKLPTKCWSIFLLLKQGVRKALSATLSLQGCYYSRLRPTSSWPNLHKLCLCFLILLQEQQNQKVWVLLEYMCCHQGNYMTTELHKIVPFLNVTLINTLYAKISLSVKSVG